MISAKDLPLDWKIIKLKDYVFFQEGPGLRNWQFFNQGIKVINVKNIVNDKLTLKNSKNFCSKEEVEKRYRHFLLEENDIVMASSGVTWGKTATVEKNNLPLMLNTSVIRFRTLDETRLKRDFLKIFLNSLYFKRQIRRLITGGCQPNFGPSHLKKVDIILPPLHVQNRIISIIEKAKQLKDLRRQSDKLTYDYLVSIFLKMFGDPTRNEKNWNKARLEDICKEIMVGIVVKPASYYVPEGVPALRGVNIKENYLKLDNLVYISEKNNKEKLSKSIIKKRDVLVVRSGYPGTACVVPDEFDGTNCIDLIIIRPNEELIKSEFLCYYFNNRSIRKEILNQQTGSAQKHFNIGAVKRISLHLPPIEIQNDFCQIIAKIETIKNFQKQSNEKIETMLDALMERTMGDMPC